MATFGRAGVCVRHRRFCRLRVSGLHLGFSFYFAYLILVPMAFVLGAWAPLGQGSFLFRVVTLTMLGPLMLEAGLLGILIGLAESNFMFGNEMSHSKACFIVALLSIPICVATQVPYWMFRIGFGWQLVQFRSDWQEKKTSLRDMFLITAVFAIAIATPHFATDMIFDSIEVGAVELGQIEIVVTTLPDGSTDFIETEVTEENIEQIRESGLSQNRSTRAGVPSGVLIYSAVVALLSLFFTPAIWLCLRNGSSVKSVCLAALFLFTLFVVIGCVVTFLTFGWQVSWGQFISYLLGFASVFTAAGIVPLLGFPMLGHQAGDASRLSETSC